jgi:DNA-binding MarR family transcriptional regulator
MATSVRTRTPYDDLPLSALLHVTRGTYTDAVRRAQAKVGCGDVPVAGVPILSAMGWRDASLESVIRFLGVTKQAVSQTIDTLVRRGYLERSRDTVDRRKVVLSLTARGRTAGNAARTAIEQVDRELRARVGAEGLARMRATLIALWEIKRKARTGSPRGGRSAATSGGPLLRSSSGPVRRTGMGETSGPYPYATEREQRGVA